MILIQLFFSLILLRFAAPQAVTITVTRTIVAIPPTSIVTVFDTQTVTTTATQFTIIPTTIIQPPSTITIVTTPPLPTVYSTVTSISLLTHEPTVTILPTTVTRFISKTGKPFHHFNYYSHRRNADVSDGNRTVALPSVFEQFLKKEKENRKD